MADAVVFSDSKRRIRGEDGNRFIAIDGINKHLDFGWSIYFFRGFTGQSRLIRGFVINNCARNTFNSIQLNGGDTVSRAGSIHDRLEFGIPNRDDYGLLNSISAVSDFNDNINRGICGNGVARSVCIDCI